MLMEAAKNGHTQVVELLMDYPDIQPLTEAQVRIPPAAEFLRDQVGFQRQAKFLQAGVRFPATVVFF